MEASSADPTISLKATGRSRRRKRINRIAEGSLSVAAFWRSRSSRSSSSSVGGRRGIKALNLDFFTKSQVTFGETGGGIANGLVGTAIMVAIATAITLPVGILAGDLRREFGGAAFRA